ncbi:MAG: universal stress protein [Microthrixaceae bacterium]
MRVLIGTDGSDDAVAAAAAGLALLAPPDEVIVACVADTPDAATRGLESGFAGGMATDAEVDEAWTAAKEGAEAALHRTVAALPDGLTIDTVTLSGDPGPAMCRLAEERGVAALVIGSRGLGAIRRALLGSVSTYVSANAPCPVVIVRSGTDD